MARTTINSAFKLVPDNIPTVKISQLGIGEAENGTIIYDLDTKTLKYFNGSSWGDITATTYTAPSGWGFYVEDQTAPSTQLINTTPSKLIIDGAGATSNSEYLPLEIRGISELWDTANNKIIPINIGDDYTVRIDMQITAKSGNPTELQFNLDISGQASPTTVIVSRIIGTGKTPPYTVSVGFPYFSLATFKANGGQIFLSTDTGDVTLTRRQISIHRISDGTAT